MSNSLFPGFVKLYYTSAYAQHVATIPANVQQDVGVWKVQCKDNTYLTTAVATAALAVPLKAMLHTSCTIDYAELWRMATPTSDPIYVETASLNIAGTSASATNQAVQSVWSYRTIGGSFGKLTLLDSIQVANQKLLPPNYGGATYKAVMDYIMAAATWIYGRDNTYPATGVKCISKYNDALRKKYNLV